MGRVEGKKRSEGIPATCGIFSAGTAERGPALAAEVEAAERSIVRLSREVRGRPGVRGPPAPSGLTTFRPRCRSPTSTARFLSSAGSCSACWSCSRAARRPPRALVVRPEPRRLRLGPRQPPPPPGAPPPPAAALFPQPPAPRGWARRHRPRRPPQPRSPRRARPVPSRSPRPRRPRCRRVSPNPSRAARPAPARSPAPVPPAPAEPREGGGTGTPPTPETHPARGAGPGSRRSRPLCTDFGTGFDTLLAHGAFCKPTPRGRTPLVPGVGRRPPPGAMRGRCERGSGGWWHPRPML